MLNSSQSLKYIAKFKTQKRRQKKKVLTNTRSAFSLILLKKPKKLNMFGFTAKDH